MTNNDLPYNRSLEALESLLAGVKRPGEFCVHGALALPMPMVEVDGIGLMQLPSPHTGGELRIRHGSREARIDLSATDCFTAWRRCHKRGAASGSTPCCRSPSTAWGN